jgi:hypothetical protein
MRNGYNFTDGCGFISKDLCSLIESHFGIKSSAFQIRLAGAKGVLMLNPALKGIKI